jgi:hypothetical protein
MFTNFKEKFMFFVYFLWNIPIGVTIIISINVTNHNQDTQFANKFIKKHLVCNLDSGQHQAMIQEYEHTQKLQTMNKEIPAFYIAKVFKVTKVKPITKMPKNVLKIISILFLKQTNFKNFIRWRFQLRYFLITVWTVKVPACCLLAVVHDWSRCIVI